MTVVLGPRRPPLGSSQPQKMNSQCFASDAMQSVFCEQSLLQSTHKTNQNNAAPSSNALNIMNGADRKLLSVFSLPCRFMPSPVVEISPSLEPSPPGCPTLALAKAMFWRVILLSASNMKVSVAEMMPELVQLQTRNTCFWD